MICLTEKIHALDKLHSGTGCSAVGREFNVNESTIHTEKGVFKQTHTQKKIMYL